MSKERTVKMQKFLDKHGLKIDYEIKLHKDGKLLMRFLAASDTDAKRFMDNRMDFFKRTYPGIGVEDIYLSRL